MICTHVVDCGPLGVVSPLDRLASAPAAAPPNPGFRVPGRRTRVPGPGIAVGGPPRYPAARTTTDPAAQLQSRRGNRRCRGITRPAMGGPPPRAAAGFASVHRNGQFKVGSSILHARDSSRLAAPSARQLMSDRIRRILSASVRPASRRVDRGSAPSRRALAVSACRVQAHDPRPVAPARGPRGPLHGLDALDGLCAPPLGRRCQRPRRIGCP
jgi:hypothetical protein